MKKFLKGLALSMTALIVGFFAISLPFHLFDELSQGAMSVVFIAEIIIYLAIGLGFLVIKDKKQQQKIKAEKRRIKRMQQIKEYQENWINIAA
ncbi:MAG: hypothetical protein ACLUFN_11125 [Eubacterium sp.]